MNTASGLTADSIFSLTGTDDIQVSALSSQTSKLGTYQITLTGTVQYLSTIYNLVNSQLQSRRNQMFN